MKLHNYKFLTFIELSKYTIRTTAVYGIRNDTCWYECM